MTEGATQALSSPMRQRCSQFFPYGYYVIGAEIDAPHSPTDPSDPTEGFTSTFIFDDPIKVLN